MRARDHRRRRCVLRPASDRAAVQVLYFFNGTVGIASRFRVENVLEELDQPGEWCLDGESGTVYFWPPSRSIKATDDVVAPALDTLIDLTGTARLGISGFTMTETGAVMLCIALVSTVTARCTPKKDNSTWEMQSI
jgi:hypothetical protein